MRKEGGSASFPASAATAVVAATSAATASIVVVVRSNLVWLKIVFFV